MARITASRKQLKPDPKFGSLVAAKFVNCLMWDDKKSTAYRAFYDALDILATRFTDKPSIEIFTEALENVKPNIEVRSKRVGGASY
ncbi:MAG: 30S ribosomal protein S7, partial [Thermoguttaceae bacterium]|nr:30S ribosomal protein S7 [Thermoguttaceae bacterium]